MTKRDILSISFKVLGVVYLFYAVVQLPRMGILIGQTVRDNPPLPYSSGWAVALAVVSWVFILAIAVFLLRRGDWIAERLVPIDSTLATTVTDVGQWGRDAFILSVKVIGVVCLVRGLPLLASGLADIAGRGSITGWSIWYLASRFVGAVVLLALGAYFISGAKHLVKFAFRPPEGMPTLDDTNHDAL